MSLERALSIDPDLSHRPAVAMKVDTSDSRSEVPMHSHRKGQLIIALRGGVTCEVPGALLMVPPQCAIWLPGGTPHSNRATANAHIWFLFVEPGCADLPDECCTLSITALLREGIRHLAELPWDYEPGSATDHLVRFLLAELARMPRERHLLPISDDPRIRLIATALADDPADRSTLAQWAARVAMSERSLARLVQKETGLSFGRWRQQLHLLVALRLLAGGATVQQVSGDLGYESVSAFITMFKKALGMPPARYFAAMES